MGIFISSALANDLARGFGDDRAGTATRLDQALKLERSESLPDSRAPDVQLLSHRPFTGKPIARTPDAGPDLVSDLVGNALVKLLTLKGFELSVGGLSDRQDFVRLVLFGSWNDDNLVDFGTIGLLSVSIYSISTHSNLRNRPLEYSAPPSKRPQAPFPHTMISGFRIPRHAPNC